MKIQRTIAGVFAVIALSLLVQDASAFYAPHMGRFLNRDPGGRMESLRIGVPGPMMTTAVRHKAIERDPVIAFARAQDYPDGFNLYRYVRSQPTIFVDPSGLEHSTGIEGIDGLPKSDTCIKRCCRDIDTTGLSWWERIGANFTGHCFLAQFGGPDCEDYERGCGLVGKEKKGSDPTDEKVGGGRGLDAVDKRQCNSCYRTKGNSKTDDEIMDCIKNTPARCDYSIFGYNCHHWAWEASEKCCVNCRPYPGPVGSP